MAGSSASRAVRTASSASAMRCVPGSTSPAASNSHAVTAPLHLARTAYAVHDSLGLQRARVHSITLRADALRPATRATRQLTLDAGDDKPLALEAVADRARTRYAHQVTYPAALAINSRPPSARQRNRGGGAEDAHGRRAT
ncbi:hypothetical protein [Streptomyces sviceus]|uniref:hypothetical protein n=1 Tax=Streptomyces sviceus TaxID=285530 RepID=UPI0036C0F95D